MRRGRSIPGDPDARFAVTRGKSHFGYKWHLAVEDEIGLGRQAELTAAELHESRKAEAFIQGDEAGFFADGAHEA